MHTGFQESRFQQILRSIGQDPIVKNRSVKGNIGRLGTAQSYSFPMRKKKGVRSCLGNFCGCIKCFQLNGELKGTYTDNGKGV